MKYPSRTSRMRSLSLLAVIAALAGCAAFPALDAATTREAGRAPYPALLPLDEILMTANAGKPAIFAAASLQSRAAALRARAAAMRGPVHDPATRARLAAAIAAAR